MRPLNVNEPPPLIGGMGGAFTGSAFLLLTRWRLIDRSNGIWLLAAVCVVLYGSGVHCFRRFKYGDGISCNAAAA